MSTIAGTVTGSYRNNIIQFIPPVLIVLLIGLSYFPRIQQNENLIHAFWLAGAFLALLNVYVYFSNKKNNFIPDLHCIARPSHYVQAIVQLCVYVYWGWFWQPVYDQVLLIVAQLVFLYALEALVAWARGREWHVGFGVFPIIFSTNLFLWFKDDAFILQFVMVTVGFLGKEFITWNKDGRRTHIFNPSAFALSIAAILLIVSNNANISWGHEIANTLAYPEHIYLCIFLLGLVVQYLFRVTLVTLSAAVTLVVVGAIYFKLTGVYFFITADIPIAVFLGLHLLVTDPSTSPRTDFGRVMFGTLYGLSVIVLFEMLEQIGIPTFYDKLLAVPLLNLTVQLLDRIASTVNPAKILPQVWSYKPHQLNKLYMAVWIVFFAALFMTDRFGDAHDGRNSTFWEAACEQNLRHACHNLYDLVGNECAKENPVACAKQGWMTSHAVGVQRNDKKAFELVKHACNLGYMDACTRLNQGEFNYDVK